MSATSRPTRWSRTFSMRLRERDHSGSTPMDSSLSDAELIVALQHADGRVQFSFRFDGRQ